MRVWSVNNITMPVIVLISLDWFSPCISHKLTQNQLLFHVHQHLMEHFLRVFRLGDHIIDIGFEQDPDSREDSHNAPLDQAAGLDSLG